VRGAGNAVVARQTFVVEKPAPEPRVLRANAERLGQRLDRLEFERGVGRSTGGEHLQRASLGVVATDELKTDDGNANEF
jgi:hypothetical protein